MHATQSIWTRDKGWQLGGALDDARLVLAFGSPGTINSAHWRELKERYRGAILLGCSTGGEIHGLEVMDDTLCVVAMTFSNTEIVAAQADIASSGGSFAAGQAIGAKLARGDLRAIFVLSDGVRGNGSDLVRGLREKIGADVVLTGGLAGDGANFGTTYVGLDEAPRPGRVAAVGFYGDAVMVGHGSDGGWDVFGPKRRITRARENVLYELDGQAALDLYKRYLGEDADQLPGSALLFPLQVYPPDRPDQAIVRTVIGIDEEAHAMTFAGNIPQGHCAQLMWGNFDHLIQGAARAAEQAAAMDGQEKVAILVSCIGRKLLLGQRIGEEIEAVRDVLGRDTPMTGFYSYGEVSPHKATGNAELHNQTMTITTLSERPLA